MDEGHNNRRMVATRRSAGGSGAASDAPRYSILLPTYNERENLPLITWLIFRALDGVCSFELIVIDDASPDGTGAVAEQLQQVYGAERVVLAPRHHRRTRNTSRCSWRH